MFGDQHSVIHPFRILAKSGFFLLEIGKFARSISLFAHPQNFTFEGGKFIYAHGKLKII